MARIGRRLLEAPDDDSRYRLLMRDPPRRFHQLTRELQIVALKDPPPLTGTRWDALLAAVTEHIAPPYAHAVPDWVQEPERFLELPWVIAEVPAIAVGSVLNASAAFILHGVFPDPLDLDTRGGETHAWVP